MKTTSSEHVGCTNCFLFWHSEQFLRTTCSELVVFMYWTGKSMSNLLSYCGLVDPRISASDKDLPVFALIFSNLSPEKSWLFWPIIFRKFVKTCHELDNSHHGATTNLAQNAVESSLGCRVQKADTCSKKSILLLWLWSFFSSHAYACQPYSNSTCWTVAW